MRMAIAWLATVLQDLPGQVIAPVDTVYCTYLLRAIVNAELCHILHQHGTLPTRIWCVLDPILVPFGPHLAPIMGALLTGSRTYLVGMRHGLSL